MEEEKKHIDRVFQEGLKDFEVTPKSHVWKNIEKELLKKKKRRIVPLWLRLGSAAAILLLLTSIGFWYFDNNGMDSKQLNPIEEPFIIKEESDSKNTNKENRNVISNTENAEEKALPTKTITTKTDNLKIKEPLVEKVNSNNELLSKVLISKKEKDIVENSNKEEILKEANSKQETSEFSTKTIKDNKKTMLAMQVDKELTQKDIAQAIEDNLKNTEDKVEKIDRDRWYVGPVVAPLQYNTFSGGSPISKSLANNEKQSNTTLAYGLKINYRLSDRVSLQSGINSVDLSYRTKDVTAFVFSNQLSFSSNLTEQANIDGANTIAVSDAGSRTQNSLQASRGAAVALDGDLNQSLSYVEVPFEAKYALTKTKLGVNIVGGFSTYILNKNSVSLTGNGSTKSLGQASNINNVNFSGNLGVDFDYKINKKIFINVSPMVKYQMNTFSKDNGGFKPYFLGVYTGLNFRF